MDYQPLNLLTQYIYFLTIILIRYVLVFLYAQFVMGACINVSVSMIHYW